MRCEQGLKLDATVVVVVVSRLISSSLVLSGRPVWRQLYGIEKPQNFHRHYYAFTKTVPNNTQKIPRHFNDGIFSQIFHCFVHAYRLKPDVVRLIEQEGSNSKQKRHIDVSVSNESPRLPCRVQLRSAKGNFWMKNNRAVITMHKQLINILTVVLRWRVASKPVIGWQMPPSNSTQITDGRGVGYRGIWQLLCFVCMQTVTADTVIAYITHDYLPKMSSASSRNWVKLRGSLYLLNSLVQLTYMNWPSACLISNHPYLTQFHTTRIIAFISKSTTYLPNYTSALAVSCFPSGFLRPLFV